MPPYPTPLTADVTREQSDALVSHAGGWVLLAMSLFWPRIIILGFWIFSDLLGDAYSSWLIPFFGFFLFPWTTGFYAMMWGLNSNAVSGWEWIVVGFAILLDVGALAQARHMFMGK